MGRVEPPETWIRESIRSAVLRAKADLIVSSRSSRYEAYMLCDLVIGGERKTAD